MRTAARPRTSNAVTKPGAARACLALTAATAIGWTLATAGAVRAQEISYTISQPVVSAVESINEALARPTPPRVQRYMLERGAPGRPPVFTDTPPAEWNVNVEDGQVTLAGPGEFSNSFPGPFFSGGVPPDPTIAVGPNSVIVAVNGEVAAYRKNGNLLWRINDFQFFASVNTGQGVFDFIFDPKVLYDFSSGRFFVVYIGTNGAQMDQSRFLIAASTTSDPADPSAQNWLKFSSTSTVNASWSDYPGVGVDDNALYITGNWFGSQTGNFTGSHIRIYPKDQLLRLPPPTTLTFTENLNVTTQAGPPASTIQPAVSYESTEEEYFASVADFGQGDSSGNRLFIYQINGGNSPRAIRKYSLTVPTYDFPPLVNARGSSVPISTVGLRLFNAVRVGGSLWCAHNVRSPTGSVASRWYEVKIESDTAVSLRQTGLVVHPKPDGSAWMPGIGANCNGDAVLVHTRASPTDFTSVDYSWRLGNDQLGTMRQSVQVKVGTSGYDLYRWGDFCTPALDPVDGSAVWGYHMYASSQLWATEVFRVPLNPADCGAGGGGGGPPPPPCPNFLAVFEPAARDNWVTSTTERITWDFQGSEDDLIDIFLLRGGVFLGAIAKQVRVGDFGYDWVVGSPLDNNAPIPAADDYRVMIRPSFCEQPIAVSTNFFTITEAVVADAAPPGAVVPAGGTIPEVVIGPGQQVQLGAVAPDGTVLTATKGMPPYTFRWSPSDFLNDSAAARPISSPLRTTTYTLSVRDATGFVATDEVTVRIDNPVLAEAGPSRTFRTGQTVLLEGAASGGVPPYSYEWSPIPDPTMPDGLDGRTDPQPLARPTGPTVYTLKVTDAVGGVSSDIVQVMPGLALTIVNNPGNGGTVTRSIVRDLYAQGDQITVQAVPNAGYVFERWVNPGPEFDNRPADPAVTFGENPTSLTFIDSDVRIEAAYRLVIPGAGQTLPSSGGTTGGTTDGTAGGTGGLCGAILPGFLVSMVGGLGLMRRRFSPGRRG